MANLFQSIKNYRNANTMLFEEERWDFKNLLHTPRFISYSLKGFPPGEIERCKTMVGAGGLHFFDWVEGPREMNEHTDSHRYYDKKKEAVIFVPRLSIETPYLINMYARTANCVQYREMVLEMLKEEVRTRPKHHWFEDIYGDLKLEIPVERQYQEPLPKVENLRSFMEEELGFPPGGLLKYRTYANTLNRIDWTPPEARTPWSRLWEKMFG